MVHHQGEVTLAQKEALDRLWEAVKNFLDDMAESKDKVPKATPLMEKARTLTLDQICPGFRPLAMEHRFRLWSCARESLRRSCSTHWVTSCPKE